MTKTPVSTGMLEYEAGEMKQKTRFEPGIDRAPSHDYDVTRGSQPTGLPFSEMKLSLMHT